MAANTDQLKAISEQIEQGIKDVYTSDKYKNYLTVMSKFYKYSYRNSLLIAMQNPQATHVAGYNAWKKNFNRQVNKGEKGIQILVPSPYRKRKTVDKIDPQTQQPMVNANGRIETEEIEIKIPSFKPMYVFDASQTSGEPLPNLISELTGDISEYAALLQSIKDVSPFPIEFESIANGVKGYCDPVKERIAIKENMSQAQTIKTAIHEITHADLHAPERELALNKRTDRNTREVEAESVAYVICHHFGVDTSDYSFPYLASWSSTQELDELKSSLSRIQSQASDLLDRIDTRYQELIKEQPVLPMPDKECSIADMEVYGYKYTEATKMLPIGTEKALEMFDNNNPIYLLYEDNSESLAEDRIRIENHLDKGGIVGIELDDWKSIVLSEELQKTTLEQTDNLLSYANQAHTIIDKPEALASVFTNEEKDYIVNFAFQTSNIDKTHELADKIAARKEPFNAIKKEYNTEIKTYAIQLPELNNELLDATKEPVVTIIFSESNSLQSDDKMTLSAAESVIEQLDAKQRIDRSKEGYEGLSYLKTKFQIDFMIQGESQSYTGRIDLGDGDKTLVNHIEKGSKSMLNDSYWREKLPESIPKHEHILSVVVPYFKIHNNLTMIETNTKARLADIEKIGLTNKYDKKQIDGLMDYQKDLLQFVDESRKVLNYSDKPYDLPEIPKQTSDYFQTAEEKNEIQTYKSRIIEEINTEALAAGMTVDDYSNNVYLVPQERTYTIYQLLSNEDTHNLKFSGMEYLKSKGITPSLTHYKSVYSGKIGPDVTLENIYQEFNINHPTDYTGHSLSVSDIVVIEANGKYTANYVDSIGYTQLPDMAKQHEQRLADERLDTLKFDNDIDLDRVKTREQHGFKDKKLSIKEKLSMAKKMSEERNSKKLAEKQQDQQKDIRGER